MDKVKKYCLSGGAILVSITLQKDTTPMPGTMKKRSLVARSTAAVTTFTWGNAYEMACRPVHRRRNEMKEKDWQRKDKEERDRDI